MTVIAQSSRRFSPSRYGLFWGYYRAVEERELSKPVVVSQLIRDHVGEVLDLHRRAGLLLQRRAETAAGAESLLTRDDLRDLAWQVLADAGYNPSHNDAPLLARIVDAATHRLVLLTPQHDGGLGFDVRSLQELMAALALTTGTLEETVPRLGRICASPHWRNTFLFAAGRYFSEPQPHQKQAVVDLVVDVDLHAPARLGLVFPVGPQLAAEIVDDGMAAEPRYLHRLLEHALTALQHPGSVNASAYAQTLITAAQSGDTPRHLVVEGLRAALGGTSAVRAAAERVQQRVDGLTARVTTRPEARALAAVKRDPSRALPPDPTPDWDACRGALTDLADPQTRTALDLVAELLQQLAEDPSRPPPGWQEDLTVYLSEPDVAEVVEEGLRHVADGEPDLVDRLRGAVITDLWRQPPMLPG